MSLINVGFIGCGNFGGQIANLAAEADFPCIAINASSRDLNLLSNHVTPFLIGDGKGTGKSRDIAKEFLTDHLSIVKDDTLTKLIESNDVIIVGASAGGGFGSGILPSFVDILTQVYPEKCIRVITTFPSDTETYEAQNHTEQFMKELLALNVPYIAYDNGNYKDLEASEMNKKILNKAVLDMRILRGDFILPCATGGIDERDLLNANSAPGRTICCMMDDLHDEDIVDGSIVNTLKSQINNSENIVMVDDRVITASAVMYNLTHDLKKYGPMISSEMQKVFGLHIADFRNETVDNTEEPPYVACILAGLSAPTTRIDKVITRRVAIENEINERKSAYTKLNTVEAGSLKLGTKAFGSKSAQKPNVDDILKKFATK